jgi:hypothetical protein
MSRKVSQVPSIDYQDGIIQVKVLTNQQQDESFTPTFKNKFYGKNFIMNLNDFVEKPVKIVC